MEEQKYKEWKLTSDDGEEYIVKIPVEDLEPCFNDFESYMKESHNKGTE